MNAKKILSAILALLMLVSVLTAGVIAEEVTLPFTDVKKNWAYEPIKYVYEMGLMNGTGDGTTFSPNRTMTRIEFATTLFRLSGAKEADYQGESKFPDVKTAWMIPAANWASEKGYVLGNQKGEFMPVWLRKFLSLFL